METIDRVGLIDDIFDREFSVSQKDFVYVLKNLELNENLYLSIRIKIIHKKELKVIHCEKK